MAFNKQSITRPPRVTAPCLRILLHLLLAAASLAQITLQPSTFIPTYGGQKHQFHALVAGDPTNSVVWSIAPSVPLATGSPKWNGGTISATGLYSIPLDFQGSVDVTAKSTRNPHITAYATVLVNARPNLIGVLASTPSHARLLHSATVIFTVPLVSNDLKSVVLQSLDEHRKVMSEIGEMHDDGLNGDAIKGDSVYTIRIPVPTDKAGWYEFRAFGHYKDPKGMIHASEPYSFQVLRNDTANPLGDLSASTVGGTLCLYWDSEPGVARDVLSRAHSLQGPWTVLKDMPHSLTTGIENTIKFAVDDGIAIKDVYYKLEEYDGSNKRIKAFEPVSVPAYSDETALLILETRPLRSRIIPSGSPERR